jgi:hypothetical protein
LGARVGEVDHKRRRGVDATQLRGNMWRRIRYYSMGNQLDVASPPHVRVKSTEGSSHLRYMKSFAAKDISCPMSSWQNKIDDVKTNVEQLRLVVRYTLV